MSIVVGNKLIIMIILNCLSKWKLSLKKWWAKFRLRECIKSEQSLYQKDLDKLVLERPRLLDMDRSADALMVKGKQFMSNSLKQPLSSSSATISWATLFSFNYSGVVEGSQKFG